MPRRARTAGPARPPSSAVPSPRWNSARLQLQSTSIRPGRTPFAIRRTNRSAPRFCLLFIPVPSSIRPHRPRCALPFGQRGRMSRTPLPEHPPEHAQYDHQRVQHAPPPLPEPDQSILRGQDGCRRPAGPQSIPTLRLEPAQMTTQGGRQLMAAQCRKPCHRLLKVHHPTAGPPRATQGGRLHVLDSEIHHVGTRDHLTKRRLPYPMAKTQVFF